MTFEKVIKQDINRVFSLNIIVFVLWGDERLYLNPSNKLWFWRILRTLPLAMPAFVPGAIATDNMAAQNAGESRTRCVIFASRASANVLAAGGTEGFAERIFVFYSIINSIFSSTYFSSLLLLMMSISVTSKARSRLVQVIICWSDLKLVRLKNKLERSMRW